MYVTKNYSTDGGDRWVIGGTLEITADATIVDPETKIKGADGADGTPGADAPWVEISHPCIIIPADAAGVAITGNAEINVQAYIGSVQKKATVTAAADDDGITVSSSNPEGFPLLSQTLVSWENAVTSTNGKITLSINIADGPSSIVRFIPWVKVPTAAPAAP